MIVLVVDVDVVVGVPGTTACTLATMSDGKLLDVHESRGLPRTDGYRVPGADHGFAATNAAIRSSTGKRSDSGHHAIPSHRRLGKLAIFHRRLPRRMG